MAFVLPFLPEFEIPVVHAEGGSVSYNYEYNISVAGDGSADFAQADEVNITGTNQTMSIKSDKTGITVYGDYYKETEQFNPVVGELYSGNYSMACKDKCLWSPKLSELPSWFMDKVLHDYGYSMLYTGFMEMDNIYGYKPYGTTRIGETLGYDVYAANGEVFDYDMNTRGNLKEYQPSGVTILQDESNVTPTWALVNSYRAVGVELYTFGIATVPKATYFVDTDGKEKKIGSPIVAAVCGDAKLTDGFWDINKSPIASALSGNIQAGYSGDANPVVLIYSSRTNPLCYENQAKADAIEYDRSTDTIISCADFCKLVADLMHAYGEPVITEKEEYMLLEAYGRKLPYELYPAQLDAVKYLMVRGIIDGTDELATMGGGSVSDGTWDWNMPINFEQAATILMRVKDKGSRLTFKEFQLTTDLELLRQGYYPTEVAVGGAEALYMAEPLDYQDAAASTHYDYFVRRSDNRALFLSSNEDAFGEVTDENPGSGVMRETTPHISGGDKDPASRYPGSYYRGRTADGWYWFQVPVNYELPWVYINSAHADNDSPAQYRLKLDASNRPGGYYILDTGEGAGDTVDQISHRGFGPADDHSYVDEARFYEAVETSTLQTASAKNDKNKVTMWSVVISCKLVEEQSPEVKWGPDDPSNNSPHSIADFYDACPPYMDSTASSAPVAWIKSGDKSPTYSDPGNDEYAKCEIYQPVGQGNSAYYSFIVRADKPISETMARAVLNMTDLKGKNQVGEGSAARTVRAYCRYGDEYLLSVNYLTSQGNITDFTDFKNGKYYFSVNNAVGTDSTDVFIDTQRGQSQLVMFGQMALIYDKTNFVVNTMGDDTFIIASAVSGRMRHGSIPLPGDAGELLCTGPVTGYCDIPYRVSVGGSDTAVTTSMTRWNEGKYINTRSSMPIANWVAVRDMRTGQTIPRVFTLYETAAPVTDPASDAAKLDFESYFGWSFDSDTMYYKELMAAPEAQITADGALVSGAENAEILCSNGSDIYLRIGDIGPSGVVTYTDVWTDPASMPACPLYYADTSRPLQSALTNWYVGASGRIPVVVDYVKVFGEGSSGLSGLRYVQHNNSGDAVSWLDMTYPATATLPGTKVSSLDSLKMQPCGLPALIANISVRTVSTSESGKLTTNPLARVFWGCDPCTSFKRVHDLPFDGVMYIMRYSGDIALLEYYKGEIVVKDPAVLSGDNEVTLIAGEPNKIADWLEWLKKAKLEDAEDILTICIIAILQWLPRIFMFIFFILMGLSMIATVKPWVVFCDRFFDPYKFLTAGRMDVHTIEIKKVVACSMIALILFGLFQNGLILDIIAWCARAVTGILNR